VRLSGKLVNLGDHIGQVLLLPFLIQIENSAIFNNNY